MSRAACTVTELNNYIKGLLDNDDVLREVCVRGELSNYKIYPSGHHYFTLKDSESSLRCVMFKGSALKLRFRPENGMCVSVFGSVSVYPRDGAYQMYCNAIVPEGTGDLQIAFEQLKEKLSAEGLFDRAHKKPLPAFPDKIAIITSAAGAAVHDMIRILGQRWPMSKVLLLPVRVQGVEAPAEIAGAIRYANEFKVADVIITGRGGGSVEDLWAFNDERVARAIFASEIPVISAVGHEPDVTISDYVADVRASTPSNAAELVVPDWREVSEYLDSLQIRCDQSMDILLDKLSERLRNMSNKAVLTDPLAHILNRRTTLSHLGERLCSAQERRVLADRQKFVKLASALDAMSPLRVMARGYAIANDSEGNNIVGIESVNVGDHIKVNFSDGSANCLVESLERN